jgi:hypothetical protein
MTVEVAAMVSVGKGKVRLVLGVVSVAGTQAEKIKAKTTILNSIGFLIMITPEEGIYK